MRIGNIDKFLEESFIPTHVINKKMETENGEVSYKQEVRLYSILRLKLSNEDKQYITKYLSDKGIQVVGYSDKVDFESEDYLYTRKYRGRAPESISKEETQELIRQYRKTKDINIRNKIFIGNMRLVNYAIISLNNDCHSVIYDLEQAGYIGLIKAIENYDPEKSAFSTFALSYIYGHIKLQLYELSGLRKSEYAFYIAMKEIEKEYGEKIADNPALAEKVMDRIIASGYRTDKHRDEFIRRIMLVNTVSLDEALENNETIYNLGYAAEDNDINSIYDVELKGLVAEQLESLQDLKTKIVKMRYGIDSDEPATLTEIGKEIDLSPTWVRDYIKRSLRHLSIRDDVKKLEYYLHRDV